MLRFSGLDCPACSGVFSKRVAAHAVQSTAQHAKSQTFCIGVARQSLVNRIDIGWLGVVPLTTPDQLAGEYPLPDSMIT